MNLLFWNVRGLGRGEKCITIRHLISLKKISLLGLVETKHKHSLVRRVRRMWGSDVYDWCESFASDTSSGGIIAIWDPSKFCVSRKVIGDRWIVLEGYITEGNFNCCVGIIYGPNDRSGRSDMFESLKLIFQNINKPLLLLEDFNEIMHPSERIGQFKYDLSMRDFLDWIHDLHLIDIPLHGIKFTWSRLESQSKLDRCLCNNEWLINFPDLHIEGLKRCSSDHNPSCPYIVPSIGDLSPSDASIVGS